MKLRSLLGIFASAVFVVGCAETDAGITTNVKSKLVNDDLVKARQIDVDTQEGVVTLSGSVNSSEEEAQALQIARETQGVTSVVDNINVSPNREQGAAPTSGYGSSAPGSDPGMAGMDMAAMGPMMTACIAMGEACAAECEQHAAMSEHCRICASACRAMVDSCTRMMASMKG